MQTISTHNTTFKICTQMFIKNLEHMLHITLCTVNFTINHWGWPWFYVKYIHVVSQITFVIRSSFAVKTDVQV